MRLHRTIPLAVCLTAVAIAPAAAGRKLVVEIAPGFDPAAHRTYAFANPLPPAGAPGTDPQADMQRAMAATIEQEFARIGWVPAAEGETPDLRVAYGGSGEPTDTGSRAVWVYDFWGGGISVYGRQSQYVGWLTIGLLEGDAENPSWQGWAKVALEPEEVKARRKLEKTIRKILGKLP